MHRLHLLSSSISLPVIYSHCSLTRPSFVLYLTPASCFTSLFLSKNISQACHPQYLRPLNPIKTYQTVDPVLVQTAPRQSTIMSSRGSYSSYSKGGNYAPRSSSPRSVTSSRSSASSSTSNSIYANSGSSARNFRYGSKPGGTVIHNGGGQTNDPNTSTSAGNSGYYQ